MDCHGLNALAMTAHSELRRQVIARSKYQLDATTQSKRRDKESIWEITAFLRTGNVDILKNELWSIAQC